MARSGVVGLAGQRTYFSTPVPLGITMPANSYPNGTVTFGNIGAGGAYWKNNTGTGTKGIGLFLCDSSGGNLAYMGAIWISASGTAYDTTFTVTGGQGLAGKELYLVGSNDTGNIYLNNQATITVQESTLNYTITCNAGTGGSLSANVSAAQAGTTITLTPSASSGYQFSSYSSSPSVTISGNQFTMPASNVTITASFTKISYSVNCGSDPAAGGSLSASPTTATMGTTITLTPTANTGYHLAGYLTNPSGISISNNRFTMPASTVGVTAKFVKNIYTITTSASTGGTLTANYSTSSMGDEVTLTPTPSTGYYLVSYTTTPSNLTITNNKFTMPAGNVSIKANFAKQSYNVNTGASPSAGGGLTASKSSANYGDEITLTPLPNLGYQFSSYTKTPSTLSITNNKFTMPAQGVSITANFTKISYSITKQTVPSGAGTIACNASANYGDTVSISQTPASGYVFTGWTTSPSVTISNGQFTMPAGNLTVTANYTQPSTATLSKTNITGGDTVRMTISARSTSFSHKYTLSFGTGMSTGEQSVAAGTTQVDITAPASWSSSIPNAESANGTLTLKTYSGSTLIGTKTLSGLKYLVPASAVPTLTDPTTSIARTIGGTTYANVGSYYVQKHCGVRTQATAAGVYSSTITSISLSIAGYTGNSYNKTVTNTTSIDFTSGLLTAAGNTTITVTATDSRGRTATKTATISVTTYNNPSGTLNVWRVNSGGTADDFGQYGKYSITYAYSTIGSNALTVRLECGSNPAVTGPAASGDILPGNRLQLSELQEFEVRMRLTDSFEETVIRKTLKSAKFIIYVNANGDKIGFMKAATKTPPTGKTSTFEIAGDTQVYIGDTTLEDYIRAIINS